MTPRVASTWGLSGNGGASSCLRISIVMAQTVVVDRYQPRPAARTSTLAVGDGAAHRYHCAARVAVAGVVVGAHRVFCAISIASRAYRVANVARRARTWTGIANATRAPPSAANVAYARNARRHGAAHQTWATGWCVKRLRGARQYLRAHRVKRNRTHQYARRAASRGRGDVGVEALA